MERKDQEFDDILENLDFKPITEGLGFHHSLKEKKEIKTNLNMQAGALKKELETRVHQLQKEATPVETKINRGDLAPFYEETVKEETKPSEILLTRVQENKEEKKIEIASFVLRFGAWLIDVSLIVFSLAVMLVGIIYFSDFPIETLSVMMISSEVVSSFSFIGIAIYIFYFSVLDKTKYSTFGKNVVGLKVVGIDNKEISLIRSFVRTFIVVCSTPFLGIPILLDVPNIFTDTQVIRK